MISIAILLFIVIDPFGNLVAINSLLADLPAAKRRLVVLREAAIATAILILAAFFGGSMLGILGLHEHTLRLSGGIVLFLIALGMLFPSRNMMEESSDEPPLVVPIAMPLIAGPSAISMVILFSKEHTPLLVSGSVIIAAVASTILLVASAAIFKFLGKRGAIALERLMGMLLIVISVEMILEGLNAYLDTRG